MGTRAQLRDKWRLGAPHSTKRGNGAKLKTSTWQAGGYRSLGLRGEVGAALRTLGTVSDRTGAE